MLGTVGNEHWLSVMDLLSIQGSVYTCIVHVRQLNSSNISQVSSPTTYLSVLFFINNVLKMANPR